MIRAEARPPHGGAPQTSRASLLVVEASFHAVLACAVAAWFAYLRRTDPVAMIRAVTEDGWVEFATAIAFAFAGVLLVVSSLKPGPSSRRVLWSLYGLVALFIAAEEISWGQRLAGVPTPDLLNRLNYQQEMNLHNLDLPFLLDPRFLILLLLIAAALLGASTGLWLFSIGVFERWRARGAPVISPALAPLIVAAVYSFFWLPVFRRSEIGELYVGLAAVAWATDLYRSVTSLCPPSVTRMLASRLGVLLVLTVSSSVAVAMFSSWPNANALNDVAASYVATGNYADAARLYDFIAANPTCRTPETDIGQARLLLATGEPLEARGLLSAAAARLDSEESHAVGAERGRLLRAKIEIYTIQGEPLGADRALQEALAFADHRLRRATDPDEKARVLWSIARAFEARQEIEPAHEYAERARLAARSHSLQRTLDRWLRSHRPKRRAQERKTKSGSER